MWGVCGQTYHIGDVNNGGGVRVGVGYRRGGGSGTAMGDMLIS